MNIAEGDGPGQDLLGDRKYIPDLQKTSQTRHRTSGMGKGFDDDGTTERKKPGKSIVRPRRG